MPNWLDELKQKHPAPPPPESTIQEWLSREPFNWREAPDEVCVTFIAAAIGSAFGTLIVVALATFVRDLLK